MPLPCEPPSSRRRGRGRRRGLSERPSCFMTDASSAAAVHAEQRRGTTTVAVRRGGLLFGYFLLAEQEKVTSRRAAPGKGMAYGLPALRDQRGASVSLRPRQSAYGAARARSTRGQCHLAPHPPQPSTSVPFIQAAGPPGVTPPASSRAIACAAVPRAIDRTASAGSASSPRRCRTRSTGVRPFRD